MGATGKHARPLRSCLAEAARGSPCTPLKRSLHPGPRRSGIMTSHTSTAIVLRIREFGESDLLVSFFTSDKGLLKGVAKGARKSRKRFVNCLDLFCLVDLEYDVRKKGDLYFLQSCRLISAFPGLRRDFSSLSLASYMVEMVEILFPQSVADQGMFGLLKYALQVLDEGKNRDFLRTLFEARAMTLGGFGIDLSGCCRCGRAWTGRGGAVFVVEKGGIACLRCGRVTASSPGLGPEAMERLRLMQSGLWDKLSGPAWTEDMNREIRTVLKLHMAYRFGRRLRSANYLDGITSAL
jgi:DNA repair protein RecO (recombination protein O)